MRLRHRPALDAQGRARLGEYEARKQTRPCPAPIDVIALAALSFKNGASPEIKSGLGAPNTTIGGRHVKQ